MSEQDAFAMFVALRYADTDGHPCCPNCQCTAVYRYQCRRVFKCKSCGKQFSPTAGTPFAHRKLSFRDILCGIVQFVTPAKSLSAVEFSIRRGVQYKTAHIFLRKLRELVASSQDDLILTGEVEIDGAEFGGHVRPRNVKKKATDHRKVPYRNSKKKQSVFVAVERGGRTLTVVGKHESDGVPFAIKKISPDAIVHADEAAHWNVLGARFDMRRIKHKENYYTVESSTNSAENRFSMLRRAAFGIYHRIAGPFLYLYAAEMAWRRDAKRLGVRARFDQVLALSASSGLSSFKGYWQRNRLA